MVHHPRKALPAALDVREAWLKNVRTVIGEQAATATNAAMKGLLAGLDLQGAWIQSNRAALAGSGELLAPPVLAAPSTLNSCVVLSLPLMASADAFSFSYGRPVPSDRLATPGARMASAIGLPSFSGSSWKSSAPMVIPEDGSVRFSSGGRATTWTLSLVGPI